MRLPPLARPLSLLTFYAEFANLCRATGSDVIVSYALSTGLPAIIAARQFRVPFLFHVIDSLHTLVPYRFVRPVAYLFERGLLWAADRTLYINEELRQYGIAMGADSKRASMIRTGVDLRRFRPDLDTRTLRAQWGLADSDVVLLFIGWLYHHTGVDVLIKHLPKLPPHVKLLVVGVGEAEARLKSLHVQLGLNERVIFTGHQPYDLAPQFMAMADVCTLYSTLLPITHYIVPIKTYEYMASGRPVLASPLPGVMRDVPLGNGVLYVSVNDLPATLTQLTDADYRRSLGEQARAFVEAHCDWDRLTDEFEVLISEMGERNS